MEKFSGLNPARVFYYFEQISAIPRGSGNREKISAFCENFANECNLRYVRDKADNVIIYKNASPGYENAEPIILQGHLDMVCQRTDDCKIDFEKDGLDLYIDGDFLKAHGTTLGADNGVAVAMIMAILESSSIPHPPIEAVLTTDEEIGMLGAKALDFSLLSSKKMINLDSEEQDLLTVSCAGGSDFKCSLPITRKPCSGTLVNVRTSGLKGGHSGVEIDAGRVNADILAGRILHFIKKSAPDFSLVSVLGGDKRNAIPRSSTISLVTENADMLKAVVNNCSEEIKAEMSDREPDISISAEICEKGSFSVIDDVHRDRIINMLLSAPNGIVEMSKTIDGLVETSLNLGIMDTSADSVTLEFALRSNKLTALIFLGERMEAFGSAFSCHTESNSFYPPWELVPSSPLQKLYIDAYRKVTGEDIRVSALHAGLECAVFAGNMKGLDCISIGPDAHNVHTPDEELSISSTERVYTVLLELLKNSR